MALEDSITMKKKYVYVEMIRQEKDKYDVISGLFRGIINKNKDTFILLGGIDDTTNVLNVDYYGVLAIEVLVVPVEESRKAVDSKKYLTVFTHEIEDQKKAIDLLNRIFDSLLNQDMELPNDPQVIDIGKYEEVPETYKLGAFTKTTTPEVNSTKFSPPVNRYQPPSTNYGGYKKVEVKAEPIPKLLKRKKSDKKPTKAELETLIEKLDAIRKGNFAADLPETTEQDNVIGDDEDMYSGYHNMYV